MTSLLLISYNVYSRFISPFSYSTWNQLFLNTKTSLTFCQNKMKQVWLYCCVLNMQKCILLVLHLNKFDQFIFNLHLIHYKCFIIWSRDFHKLICNTIYYKSRISKSQGITFSSWIEMCTFQKKLKKSYWDFPYNKQHYNLIVLMYMSLIIKIHMKPTLWNLHHLPNKHLHIHPTACSMIFLYQHSNKNTNFCITITASSAAFTFICWGCYWITVSLEELEFVFTIHTDFKWDRAFKHVQVKPCKFQVMKIGNFIWDGTWKLVPLDS